jgi:hypothetical protein
MNAVTSRLWRPQCLPWESNPKVARASDAGKRARGTITRIDRSTPDTFAREGIHEWVDLSCGPRRRDHGRFVFPGHALRWP